VTRFQFKTPFANTVLHLNQNCKCKMRYASRIHGNNQRATRTTIKQTLSSVTMTIKQTSKRSTEIIMKQKDNKAIINPKRQAKATRSATQTSIICHLLGFHLHLAPSCGDVSYFCVLTRNNANRNSPNWTSRK
jgi:hypothetical protein